MQFARFPVLAPLLAVVLTLQGLGAWAQASTMRDPTQPPASVGGVESSRAPSAGLLGGQPAAILVRNGKPYLVVGTRLYAQGQQMGRARVERITETEVWLREDGVVRKLPLFAGIERRPAVPAPANNACAKATAGKPAPASAAFACAAAPQ